MTKTKQIFALAFAASLALAGCSGSSSDDSSAATTSPAAPTSASPSETPDALPSETPTESETPEADGPVAAGEKVSGTSYTYSLPEGWESQPGDSIPGYDFDSIGMDAPVEGKFTDNINVLAGPSQGPMSEKQHKEIIDSVEAMGNTNVEARDSFMMDGANTIRVSSQGTNSGLDYFTDQYAVTNADNTYVITFSFAGDHSEADRDDLAKSVLNSWTWS